MTWLTHPPQVSRPIKYLDAKVASIRESRGQKLKESEQTPQKSTSFKAHSDEAVKESV